MPPIPRRARPVPRLRAALAVAALAALLAGCGSDDDGGNASATTTGTSGSPAASATRDADPTTVTVRVADMTFSPADLRISVGDTVTWEFDDSAPHSVQGIGDDAMGINSPILNEGEWSYTFIAPGTYRYLCSLHPEMRGTVIVD